MPSRLPVILGTPERLSSYRALPWSSFTVSVSQVGDQIVEINGEATQGITHTRAIELIQAGGNKVHLLLRPGQGLVPDHSEWPLRAARMDTQLLLQIYLLITHYRRFFLLWMPLKAGCSVPLCPCMCWQLRSWCFSSLILLLSRSTSSAFLSALVFCISTAISTYLSFPPIGPNSSSTLCFYMKPEQH